MTAVRRLRLVDAGGVSASSSGLSLTIGYGPWTSELGHDRSLRQSSLPRLAGRAGQRGWQSIWGTAHIHAARKRR